jgi:hypothetical protein
MGDNSVKTKNMIFFLQLEMHSKDKKQIVLEVKYS